MLSYHAEVLADNPLVLWPLCDAPGYTLLSHSGNRGSASPYRGDWYGSPTQGVAGPISGVTATLIDAAGDYGYSTDFLGGLFAFPGGSITLECWVKKSSVPGGTLPMTIIGIGNPPGGSILVASIRIDPSGHAQAYAYDNTDHTLTGSTNICDGNWHHIAMTAVSGGVITLYVDGASNGTPISMPNPLWGASSYPFFIGSYVTPSSGNTAEPVGVSIGWVALYDTAVSATRIAAHAAATTVRILGYPSGGSGGNTLPEKALHAAGPFTPSQDGLLTSISAMIGDSNGGFNDAAFPSEISVYEDSGGYPGVLVATGRVTAPGDTTSGRTVAWQTYTLPTPVPVVASKSYWFAFLPHDIINGSSTPYGTIENCQSPFSGVHVVYNNGFGSAVSPDPFPSPGGFGGIAWMYGMYATIEPTATVAPATVAFAATYPSALTLTRIQAHYGAGGGVVPNTYIKTGIAISARAGSGADALTSAETGNATSPRSGGGVEVYVGSGAVYIKQNIGISDRSGGGAKSFQPSETGTGISVRTGSGAKSFNPSETGTGISVSTGGGVKSFNPSETGTGISARTGNGPDSFQSAETGAGILQRVASGADVATLARTGIGISPRDGGGASSSVTTSTPVFKNFSTGGPATGTTVTAPACAVGDSVAVGDLLVLTANQVGGSNMSTVTDTKGNTWALSRHQDSAFSTEPIYGSVDVWYCLVTVAMTNSDVITATWVSASANKCLMVAHFANIGNPPLDKVAGQFFNAPPSGALSASTTAATTQASEVVIGSYVTYVSGGAAQTFTPGSGFTSIGQFQWATNQFSMYMEYRLVAATGTQTAPSTDSVTPTEYWGLVTTYKGSLGVTYTKSGIGISDHTGGGADSFQPSETGIGISVSTGQGADSFQPAETGIAISAFAGQGAKSFQPAETGNGISPRTGSGADALTSAETGIGISAFVASGADVFQATEAGIGISPFTGGGVEQFVSGAGNIYNKQNIGISDRTGGGAKSFQPTETGIGISPRTGQGADSFQPSETGIGISVRTGNGPDVFSPSETGAGISPHAGGGVEVYVSGGVVYSKTGIGISDRVASGADSFQPSETGIGISVRTGNGPDSFQPSETGIAISVSTGGGADSFQPSETGTGISPRTGGGVEQYIAGNIYVKSGIGISDRTGSGADSYQPAETGIGISVRTGQGADAFTTAETGAGISPFVASGADTFTATETGIGISPHAGQGADSFQPTETGITISDRTGTGSDDLVYGETGIGISPRSAAGLDNKVFAETGVGITPHTGGGVEQFTLGGGGTVYSKSGIGISSRVASGIKGVTINKSGLGISTHDVLGAKAATFAESGSGISTSTGSGANAVTYSRLNIGISARTGGGARIGVFVEAGTGITDHVGTGFATIVGINVKTGTAVSARTGTGDSRVTYAETGVGVSVRASKGASAYALTRRGTGVMGHTGSGVSLHVVHAGTDNDIIGSGFTTTLLRAGDNSTTVMTDQGETHILSTEV